MSDYIKHKEYKLPNGGTVTAEFNELGLATITIQAMDALFDILNSSDVVEVVRCKDCIYYDPPHVEDHGERREYIDMPREAFDKLGTGFVNSLYGVNVGGRCCRDYNAGYSEDKRVYVSESNYCGRAEKADT